MDANKMGAFIASIRKEKGMTQAELAEAAGVTRRLLSDIEGKEVKFF